MATYINGRSEQDLILRELKNKKRRDFDKSLDKCYFVSIEVRYFLR